MESRVAIDEFTWREMTSHLANAHSARLAFGGADGPHVALIAVAGDREGRIVFCTGDDPQLNDLDGWTVAIEIDGCGQPIAHHWYITTVGTARDITANATFATLRADHRARHPNAIGRWIVVEPQTFTGRRDRRTAGAEGWFAGVPGS